MFGFQQKCMTHTKKHKIMTHIKKKKKKQATETALRMAPDVNIAKK